MGTVARSVLVRRGSDDVAKVVTDPDRVLPIIVGFGRFEFITAHRDGYQEWDLFLRVGTIHVGGRVLVEPPSATGLIWRSIRGTRHHGLIEITPDADATRVSMSVIVEFAGRLTGRFTGLFADGILGRQIEAGLQQLRHHIEYGD